MLCPDMSHQGLLGLKFQTAMPTLMPQLWSGSSRGRRYGSTSVRNKLQALMLIKTTVQGHALLSPPFNKGSECTRVLSHESRPFLGITDRVSKFPKLLAWESVIEGFEVVEIIHEKSHPTGFSPCRRTNRKSSNDMRCTIQQERMAQ